MRFVYIFISLLLITSSAFSQVISNAGATATISTATVISGGTLANTSGTLINAGTISLSSDLTNAGTLTGFGNYIIAGNWTNTGTFISTTETVTLNGSGIQTVTGTSSFAHLVINNINGLSLTSSLTINGSLALSAGTLSIGPNTLTVKGGVSGSGTLSGSSASNLTIGGVAGTLNFTPGFRSLKNLTLTANASATLGTPLEIVAGSTSGTVVVNAGATLASAGNLILRSNAAGTARVGNSAGAITGNVTVERYIPGRRKYRLITSSVTTSTSNTLASGQEASSIWGNWQTAGNNVAGSGNIITGGTVADGFDQQTTTASVYTYDDVNRRYVGFTSANGKNTKYTPLKAGVPYYMFVYGDRTNSIITSTPGNTTLTATGTLLLGDQTFTTSSSIPLSNVTGRYTMLGNPFASPIDWASVVKTNIAATYWGWDPNLSSTGGYVTVNSSGTTTLISPYSGTTGLNQYIQPGQGFFVQTTAASPQLIIREQDKVSNFNASAFRTRSANDLPLIAVNLLYDNAGTNTLADGVLAAYDATFSNAIGKEDAVKMQNASESISISRGTELLSIDAAQLPQITDTISLNILQLKRSKYTLQVFVKQLDQHTTQPFLEDTYLRTTKALSKTDTTNIEFTIDLAKAASFDPKRFKIIFRKAEPSTIAFINLQATLKEKDAHLQWQVQEDNTVKKYEIEHSADNISFNKKGEVAAKGIGSKEVYQWVDAGVTSPISYYRIKSIHSDGRSFLSKTVSVKIETPGGSLKVFPNPVRGGLINLQLENIEPGEYIVALITSNGIQVYNKEINHSNQASYPIQVGQPIPPGVYYLQLKSKSATYNKAVLIQR